MKGIIHSRIPTNMGMTNRSSDQPGEIQYQLAEEKLYELLFNIIGKQLKIMTLVRKVYITNYYSEYESNRYQGRFNNYITIEYDQSVSDDELEHISDELYDRAELLSVQGNIDFDYIIRSVEVIEKNKFIKFNFHFNVYHDEVKSKKVYPLV